MKYGQAFEASPLPDDVAVMQERCCYLNSYTLAAEQPERFTYFEGYASTLRANGWGTDHAWCVDREGRVVDPTWANFTSDRPGAYLRLPIPLAVVKPYALLRVARYVRRMAPWRHHPCAAPTTRRRIARYGK